MFPSFPSKFNAIPNFCYGSKMKMLRRDPLSRMPLFAICRRFARSPEKHRPKMREAIVHTSRRSASSYFQWRSCAFLAGGNNTQHAQSQTTFLESKLYGKLARLIYIL